MTKGVFLWLHRWFGLIVGFYFVLLGLSGSYLVYRDEIDVFLKQNLHISHAESSSVDLQKLISSAKDTLNPEAELLGIAVPQGAHKNAALTFNTSPGERPSRTLTVYVDPSNMAVVGQESFRETLSGWIFFFHHDLLMGSTGRLIMGVSGLMMLALLLTGTYLWWPKGLFRRGFRPGPLRTAYQKNYELHKLTGIYSLLLMIAVTFTGTYLSKPQWFGGGGGKRPPRSMKAPPLEVSQIQDWLTQAKFSRRGWQVRKRGSRILLHEETSERRLILDAHSGAPSEEAAAFSMRKVQHDIHAGHFWGEIGRGLIFLSGILPAFFYATGVFVWWKKRRRRP